MANNLRKQASLGTNFIKKTKRDNKVGSLIVAKVKKVYYQEQTVELVTVKDSVSLGNNFSGTGKLSAPFPKEFNGLTPEGNVYGNVPLITPGMIVLVGFIDSDVNNPIIVSTYGTNEFNRQLVRTPMISGDNRDSTQFKYNTSKFNLYPSLNMEYIDGEGDVFKSWNGNTFLSVTSDSFNQESSTDYRYGTDYKELDITKYANGSLIESRIKTAPNVLYKHTGYTDIYGNEDNHITMFYLESDGTFRHSVLNEDSQFRTYTELTGDGNYRVRLQEDSIVVGEGQDYLEFGINRESQSFYITNPHHDFEFRDEGIYLDGYPMIDNIDKDLNKAFERLDELSGYIGKIEDILSGLGERDLRELINDTNTAIELTSKNTESIKLANTTITNVSTRLENAITKYDNMLSTIQVNHNDLSKGVENIRTDLNQTKSEVSTIKNLTKSVGSSTFRDIKIHADLPFKFKDYNTIIENEKVTYLFPQGLAIHDGYTYIIHSAPESGSKRLVVVYDELYNYVNMFFVGTSGGEGLHVENEGSSVYLYARTDSFNIGKFDITNIKNIQEKSTLTPIKEFNLNAYMNFFRTKDGWGVEYYNQTKGVYLQRDTIVFFNKDFSKRTGYLWINPSNSTLWSDDLLNGVTNNSAKKQGMTLVNNTIVQTLGGNYNPSRDTEIHTYHLQGVQEISPSGDIMNDYTYHPQELRDYLSTQGKTVDIIEHEGAFSYNNRLFSIIVYKGRTNANADKQGVLIVEYKPKEKDYTFNAIGEPFLAPTANYNPYKTNIDNKLVNEYTGDFINTIEELILYMKDTFQDNIVFYSSKITIKDFGGGTIPTGCRVEVENMDSLTYYVKIKGLSYDYFYQVIYNDSTGKLTKYNPNYEYATKDDIKNSNNTGIVVSKEEPQEAMVWFEVTD